LDFPRSPEPLTLRPLEPSDASTTGDDSPSPQGSHHDQRFTTANETFDVAMAPSANKVGQASSLSFFPFQGHFHGRGPACRAVAPAEAEVKGNRCQPCRINVPPPRTSRRKRTPALPPSAFYPCADVKKPPGNRAAPARATTPAPARPPAAGRPGKIKPNRPAVTIVHPMPGLSTPHPRKLRLHPRRLLPLRHSEWGRGPGRGGAHKTTTSGYSAPSSCSPPAPPARL
jgi:hypothetical protein